MSLRLKEYLVLAFVVGVVVVAFVFTFNGAFGEGGATTEPVSARVPASAAPASAGPAISVPAGKISFSEELSSVEEIADGLPALSSEIFASDFAPAVSGAVPTPARERAKPPRPAMKSFSCVGQICIDADTGAVLSSRNADVRHPPASVTKLMTIFLVLDAVKSGKLALSDSVTASRRAQNTEGTRVYLEAGEVNTVDDMLYALMLRSANDVAIALAEKVSGSVEAFVDEMNAKARALNLQKTEYSTPHGLPISKQEKKAGKRPDMTTAADMAQLSRELIKAHPNIFRYCAAKTKVFRELRVDTTPLPISNHNKLLWLFPGCDGLKTGWINAGASIVTTASRGHRRVIAVVLGGIVPGAQKGSVDAKTSQRERNQRAAELMYDGLKQLDVLRYEPTPEVP